MKKKSNSKTYPIYKDQVVWILINKYLINTNRYKIIKVCKLENLVIKINKLKKKQEYRKSQKLFKKKIKIKKYKIKTTNSKKM